MTSRNTLSGRENGFALIVALLALMLLTFLGLTLSATTSTELQISNNYRWSQQALYNAEAGLDVARVILRRVGDGQLVLPEARTGTWSTTTGPLTTPTPRFAGITRNFESGGCDTFGAGAGYGQVLVDPNNAAVPYQNISTAFGETLNGGFTVWVRREILFNPDGTASDNPAGERVIVTAEGSAPFAGTNTAFTTANRSIRRLESRVQVTEGCTPGKKQAGGFSGCAGS